MELQTIHRNNKVCTERKKTPCAIRWWDQSVGRREKENLNVQILTSTMLIMCLTLVLKTYHIVPVDRTIIFKTYYFAPIIKQ